MHILYAWIYRQYLDLLSRIGLILYLIPQVLYHISLLLTDSSQLPIFVLHLLELILKFLVQVYAAFGDLDLGYVLLAVPLSIPLLLDIRFFDLTLQRTQLLFKLDILNLELVLFRLKSDNLLDHLLALLLHALFPLFHAFEVVGGEGEVLHLADQG